MQRKSLLVTIPKNCTSFSENEKKAIRDSKCVILKLSRSYLKKQIVMIIMDCLKNNMTIKTVIMDHCTFEISSFDLFARTINQMNVKRLEIRGCLTEECIAYSFLIGLNKSLQELYLECVPGMLCYDLFNDLANNKNLVSFGLENFSLQGMIDLRPITNMLKTNKTLKKFELPGLGIYPPSMVSAEMAAGMMKDIALKFGDAFLDNNTLCSIDLKNFHTGSYPQLRDEILGLVLEGICKTHIHDIQIGPCSDQLNQKALDKSFAKEHAAAFLAGTIDNTSNVHSFFRSRTLYDKRLMELILNFAGFHKP